MAHVSDSDAAADAFTSQEHPLLEHEPGNDNKITLQDSIDSLNDMTCADLEINKKRLLEELESALVPKEDADKTQNDLPPIPIPNPNPVRPSFGLGIEVIDETALLETIPRKTTNGKQSRRSAAKREGGVKESHRKTCSVTEEKPIGNSSTTKTKYSRNEMEALRFVNVSQQRKFWKAIYTTLQTAVAEEYDTLVTVRDPPLPCPPSKKPILSVGAADGRCRYMNVYVH